MFPDPARPTMSNWIMISYDDSCITFIATKTDDVSCSEVINALNLEDELDLQAIEAKIYNATEQMSDLKSQKISAEKRVKGKFNIITERV
jgi:hypothetical protein